MTQQIVLINFKIIVVIIISLAFMLTLFLLKEKKIIVHLFRQANKRKENAIPVTYTVPPRGLTKWFYGIFVHCRKLLTTFAGTKTGENVRLFLKIAGAVLFIRLMLIIIVYAGLMMNHSGRVDTKDQLFTSIEKIWVNVWDSAHYMNIAQNWYQNTGESRLMIVFFPLYPFLMHVVHHVVPNYFYSGFIVSNLSLIIACFYLYKLASRLFSKKVAANSVKYLLLFPYAFFFGLIYTESLFIMLSVMTFYYATRRDWALAGIMGMLASLTRIQGVLLLLPVVYEYIKTGGLQVRLLRHKYKAAAGYFLKTASFILLIPFGTFIYLLINKMVTGDWFKFLEHQSKHWSQSMGFFADSLTGQLDRFFNDEVGASIGLWLPPLLSFALVTALIFYSFKRLSLSYTIYMLTFAVVSYSPTWLLSGSRYLSVLFTVYILLALLTQKELVDKAVTFIFTILLGFCTLTLFLTAYIL